MADVRELNVKIGAKTADLDKGLKSAQKQLQNFAATVGVALGGREIFQFTSETVRLSGIAEGVADAFERIATPGLLDDLVRATRGTVSQLELMQQAVRARNFKIPLDVLSQGLEFATRRAKETGEAVDFLVNSFVTGIGRKSALVMDNLGISAIELQQEVKKVGDFATAVGNIMTREMAVAGDQIDTVADKTARMNAKWKDTTKILGYAAVEALNLKENLDEIRHAIMNEI